MSPGESRLHRPSAVLPGEAEWLAMAAAVDATDSDRLRQRLRQDAPACEVRASVIAGLGMFARRAFEAGTRLSDWNPDPPRVVITTMATLPDAFRQTGRFVLIGYLFGTMSESPEEMLVLAASELCVSDFCNHQPATLANAEVHYLPGELGLYARRDIAPGEEITFDYAAMPVLPRHLRQYYPWLPVS
ncbi:MAG: SET domain-containing protein-lysine N-methyltransferase [Candidatus Melainabacteria bacterium]